MPIHQRTSTSGSLRRTVVVAAVASAAVITGLLVGCAPTENAESVPASTRASAPSVSPTPTRTPPSSSPTPSGTPTSKLGAAIVIKQCGSSPRLLFAMPKVQRVREDKWPSGVNCGVELPRTMSRDGNRIAYTIKKTADNSSHVGWYEDGSEVDITSTLPKSSGALSAVRQDMYPTFDWDGNFVFEDTYTKMFITVSTTTRKVLKEESRGDMLPGPFFVALDGSYGLATNDFTSPHAIPGDPDSRFCSLLRNDVQFYPGDGTAVLADMTVIRDDHVSTASGCNGTTVIRSLVPETDYSLSKPTYDPSNSTVYFIGARGTECALFSVPLGGGTIARTMDLAKYSKTCSDLQVEGLQPPTTVG